MKILKLHGKWQHKKHFWCVFDNKIVATALLASLTAFLWFSFWSQPKTNDVLNGLATSIS